MSIKITVMKEIKRYRCIKEFRFDSYSENGGFLEKGKAIVPVGSI